MSYDPTIGRFIQRDPIGYDDGTNLYQFVGSNPVNRVDPTGLAGEPTTKPTSKPTTAPAAPPLDAFSDLIKHWEESTPGTDTKKWLDKELEKQQATEHSRVGSGNVEFKGFDGERAKYLKYFQVIPEDPKATSLVPATDGMNKNVDGVILSDYKKGFWLKVSAKYGAGASARIVYTCSKDGKPGYDVQRLGGEVFVTYEGHKLVPGSTGDAQKDAKVKKDRDYVNPVLHGEYED